MTQLGIPKYLYVLPTLAVGIGFLVVVGWIMQLPVLISLHPSLPPMSINTAFGLLVGGFGVLAWLTERRSVLRVCAGVLIGVGLISVAQAGFGWRFGFDQLLTLPTFLAQSEYFGRVAFSSALCLVLLGCILAIESFAPNNAKLPIITWCLNATIVLFALLTLTSNTMTAPHVYSWVEYSRMAVHASIGFILLCGTVLTISYGRSRVDQTYKLHTLAMLGVAVLGVWLTLFFWYALHNDSYHNNLKRFQKDSAHYAQLLGGRLEIYRDALRRQAQRLQSTRSDEATAAELKRCVADFPQIDQLQIRAVEVSSSAAILQYTQPGVAPINTDWLVRSPLVLLAASAAENSAVFDYQAPYIIMIVDIGDRLQRRLVAHVNASKIAAELIPASVARSITSYVAGQDLDRIEQDGGVILTQSIRIENQPIAELVLQSTSEWIAEFDNHSYYSVLLGGLAISLLLGLLVNRNFRWRATHASLSRLQEIVPIGLIAVDSAGEIVFVNRFMLELVGYTSVELMGQRIEILVPPELENHAKWRAGFVKMASSRSMGKGMLELMHKAGSRIAVEIALNVTRTAKGVVTMATVINASERARLMDELSSQKNHLENLLRSMGEGVWGLDEKGDISFVNPAACKMLGYDDVNELLGKPMHDKVHYKYPDGTDYPRQQCHIHRSLKEGDCHEIDDEVFWRKDGSPFPVEYVSTPVRNGEKIVGVVVVFHDISQRHRLEALEKEYKQNLERVNQELKEFSYVASHDLQEPLRTLKGYCEFLAEDVQANDEQGIARDMRVITNATERMQQLIKDLLEYSRSGRASIDLAPVNLNECLSVALENLESLINKIGVTFAVDEFPPVLGDATMLTRILQNLIHNAIKFRGEHPLKVNITRIDNGKDGLTLCIADNGIGIDAKHHDDIFKAFKRLHSISDYEGSGLGLAIVKKIIDKHQGHIWVESSPGQGSKFYISLLDVGSSSGSSSITAIY